LGINAKMEGDMAKYIFAYHGGKMPKTPEEGARVMQQWTDWYAAMGSAVADGGAPCGPSKTVSAGAVEDNGGANPLSGYTVVTADSFDDAVKMAQGCPVLDHGTVEVCELMEM
jgi:hypothetical protein